MKNDEIQMLFTFKPNLGIGPFLFGQDIATFLNDDRISTAIKRGSDDDRLSRQHPDLNYDSYFISHENNIMYIYTSGGKIIDFNTDILYYNNVDLIGSDIRETAKILCISQWDNEELFEVIDSWQKIYYLDSWGIMFWTEKDIILNASIYQSEPCACPTVARQAENCGRNRSKNER